MAGHLAFTKYTQASGLVSNYIFDLYQDRDGFIWIATDRGVSRFDGRTFTNFTRADGLSANHVYTIFQDSSGNLWFGTYEGGVVQYTSQGMRILNQADGLLSNTVMHITQDRFGRMYFMTENGLTIYRDSVLANFENREHLSGNLFSHDSGKIFFNLDDRLFVLRPDESRSLNPEPVKLNAAEGQAISMRSWASPVMSNGNILLYPGRNQGLKLRLNGSGDILETTVMDQACFALLHDHEGGIWLAKDHGLQISTSGKTKMITRESGLDPDYIEALLEDFEGNIWLGTMGGGLYKYKGDHLTYYNTADGLISEFVNTIYEDKAGSLLVGTMQGLSRITPDHKIENVRLQSYTREIISLQQDHNGQYYAGTFHELYGPMDDHFKIADHQRQVRYVPAGVSSIYVSPDEAVWVSTFGDGVFCFRDGVETRLTKTDGLPANVIEEIVPGLKGLWFLSREFGAARLHGDSLINFNRKDGLPSEAVYSLLEEPGGVIWFGTDRGLARLQKKQVTIYDSKDGLLGNYILGIFRQGNRLILVSDKALHFLEGGKIRVYTGSALLPSGEVHIRRVYYSGKNGLIWLATNSGVIRVDIHKVETRRQWLENRFPNILFTKVQSDTSCIYKYFPSAQKPPFSGIELSPMQNNIRFNFAGISFLGEMPIQYTYRLEGFDPVWSRTTILDEVNYHNLASGSYTFQVRAINTAGIESRRTALFPFMIKPPYWQRAWFLIPALALGIIVLILSGFLISSYGNLKKIRRLEQEKALQEARQKTRESIAAELHDDVASTLSSISLLTDSLKTRLKREPEKADALLNRLGELSHEAQETMEEVVWSLSPHHDTIQQLILRICDFAGEYCSNNNLLCKTELLESIVDFPIDELTRKSIYLIVKEAMHNIIKHARASQVVLRIGITGSDFLLEIKDNGVGFDLEETAYNQRSGHGLLNMNNRARQIQAQLDLHSEKGKGMHLSLQKEITQMGH